jgi:hypothetical protein
MLIRIVLETEAVPDKKGSVGELAITEVYLTVLFEVGLAPRLHFEVRISLFAFFFCLLEMLPAHLFHVSVLNSSLVFDFLVLSSL